MDFDKDPNVYVDRDEHGVVHSLDHVQQPYTLRSISATPSKDPVRVSREYLAKAAPTYQIPESFVQGAGTKLPEQQSLANESPKLLVAEPKQRGKNTIVSYHQTALGLPVWKSSFNVMLDEELNIVSSFSSVKADMTPPQDPSSDAKLLNDITEDDLLEVLKLKTMDQKIRINKQNLLVYLYDPKARLQEPAEGPTSVMTESGCGPTLDPLPVPDSIKDGVYYVVREVLFTWALPEYGSLNWRALIEVETARVLYLRALVAGWGHGYVYTKDPFTRLGVAGPAATGWTADLDHVREKVLLPGLIQALPQDLRGEYVRVVDFDPPRVQPPTSITGDFDNSVPTEDFAAVNAYHQMAFLFWLMEDLGFDVRAQLFNSTAPDSRFPLPVDHRGFNDAVNAMAPGNTWGDGSGGFIFGLAAYGKQVPMSADFRVAAHEFCHALLWDAVGNPNFGFAHSAGDALGSIHCDPGSQLTDRFETFPWSPVIYRRHDRDVGSGWAWGGVHSLDRQYSSEQILSTTLFRVYQAIGGNSTDLARRVWASRYTLYLIVAGIASLTAQSRTATPYASAMMAADSGMILGHPGGGVRKIIRWSFEKQGLYQPPTTTGLVTQRGAPPPVDVYIEDGRDGEYEWKSTFDQAGGVWNRRAPNSGPFHETPSPGVSNYVYAAVENRGTQTATQVVVTAHQTLDISGAIWPASFTPLTIASLTAPDIPPGGRRVVGPFQWTPFATTGASQPGILVSVNALGDLAINNPASGLTCAAGPVPVDKLAPFDNNIALRAV